MLGLRNDMLTSTKALISVTLCLVCLFWICSGLQAPVVDHYCKDVITNCGLYLSNCHDQYEQWAQVNCNMTCKFCVGDVEPPCEDSNPDCDAFDTTDCTNPAYQHWAETSCRFHCRRCSPEKLAEKLASLTTIQPAMCQDKVECRLYGKSTCIGQYAHWAKDNCKAFCGFCKGIPTPPRVCADSIPNCAAYGKATCSDSKYTIWVQDSCPKYCDICAGGSVVATPAILPHHGPTQPIAPTFLTPFPARGK